MANPSHTHGSSLQAGIIIILGVCTLLSSAAYYYAYTSQTQKRSDTLSVRKIVLEHQETLNNLHAHTFLPGSGDNENRKELNAHLNLVLTGNLNNDERFRISKAGLAFAHKIQEEIYTIEKKREGFRSTKKTIASLQNNTQNKRTKNGLSTLVAQSDKYIQKTLEAQQLLSSMNDQTAAIFERILENNGSLTETHIRELNKAIPKAEQNFDDLFFLYKDLENRRTNIKQTIAEILSSY